MSIILKRNTPAIETSANSNPLMHVIWFCAAGLFVSILLLTYGIDLSPGLF